jgi:hypothetical protein
MEESPNGSVIDSFRIQATMESFIRKDSYSRRTLVGGAIRLSILWLHLVPRETLGKENKRSLDGATTSSSSSLANIPPFLSKLLSGKCRQAILDYLSDLHRNLRHFFPEAFFSSNAPRDPQADTITSNSLSPSDKQRLDTAMMTEGLDGTWTSYEGLLEKILKPYFDAVGDFYLEVSLLDPSKSEGAVYVVESGWGLAVTAEPGKVPQPT